MKYIKDYHNSPRELLEEADRQIACIHKLVGDGASHWNLSLGVSKKRRAEAKEIVHRSKLLEDLVKQRTRD